MPPERVIEIQEPRRPWTTHGKPAAPGRKTSQRWGSQGDPSRQKWWELPTLRLDAIGIKEAARSIARGPIERSPFARGRDEEAA
jgi:hypothetical protein